MPSSAAVLWSPGVLQVIDSTKALCVQVAALLFVIALCFPAHAAYTNATPPPGVTVVNGQSWLSPGASVTPATGPNVTGGVGVNVGGRVITAPARWRFATNAGRYIVRGATLHPAIRGAAIVTNWLALGNFAVDAAGGWTRTQYCYSMSTFPGDFPTGCRASAEALAQEYVTWSNRNSCPGGVPAGVLAYCNTFTGCSPAANNGSTCTYQGVRSYDGHTVNGNIDVIRVGNGQPQAVPSTDVENWGDTQPPPEDWPQGVPSAPQVPGDPEGLPGAIPMDPPTIQPGDAPDFPPEPRRYPNGDPYAIPGTDPQIWREPVVDVRPTPAPGQPYRVDVRPGTIDSPSPTPTPAEGVDIPSGGSAPNPEAVQLCEAFPDISACQQLGEPPGNGISPPLDDRTLTIPDGPTFGPENAACPPDRTINTGAAGALTFSWQGACMFADGVRPVVVGLAFLGSVLMFFGIGKRDD